MTEISIAINVYNTLDAIQRKAIEIGEMKLDLYSEFSGDFEIDGLTEEEIAFFDIRRSILSFLIALDAIGRKVVYAPMELHSNLIQLSRLTGRDDLFTLEEEDDNEVA